MHFLILGGTGFLGARTVEAALERGHQITLFTRGKTKAQRFSDEARVTHLIGDRDPKVDAGLAALEALAPGTHFDAVLDISGYVPRHVAASAELLAPMTDTYLFVSTVSVYADPVPMDVTEDGALIKLEDPLVEEVTGETYGGLKVICEDKVRSAAAEKTLVVRPCIIAGPDDFTDRFTYWAVSAANSAGGQLLCPGNPEDRAQIIDAADLGLWLVELSERGATAVRTEEGADVFNATSPPGPTTIGELIQACVTAAPGEAAEMVWVPADFLEEQGVVPFADMPLWVPAGSGHEGKLATDSTRAYGAGLRARPMTQTATETLAWVLEDLPKRKENQLVTGLKLDRASEVIQAWQAKLTSSI